MSIITCKLPDPRLAFWPRCRSIVATHGAAVAMLLSTLGWSLMWAQALLLVQFVSNLACVACFFTGLALIPCVVQRERQ